MSLTQRIALTKLQAWTASRPTLSSGALRIPALPDVASLIYRTPDWKTHLIERVFRVRNGAFVDVGANIGQTFIDYTEASSRAGYIGFEPNPRCVEILTSIVRLNRIKDARILPIGLSDTSTVVPFFVRPDRATDTTATMLSEMRPDDTVDTTYVPVYPFDTIYRDVLGSPNLALVKIDVEGAELLVLRGMRETLAQHRPWVLCEVLARDPSADHTLFVERCVAIMQIIKDVDYLALRAVKSADDKTVVRLYPVDVFPDVVYGPETMHDCEYIFVPAADVVELAGLCLPIDGSLA